MSAKAGQWSDDEIEDLLDGDVTDESSVIKNLRAALRAKTKQANEYRTELDGVRTTSRKSTLATLLTDRDLDAKIATFIPPEVEATEEAVDKWLGEYGDIFGAKPAAPKQDGPPADQIAAMRQMDAFTAQAAPAEINDQLRAVQNAETPEALIALIQAAGGAG